MLRINWWVQISNFVLFCFAIGLCMLEMRRWMDSNELKEKKMVQFLLVNSKKKSSGRIKEQNGRNLLNPKEITWSGDLEYYSS